ncbi:MAG: PAS domain S-box protein [Bacteroidales bacterium]|nr:PAS domain S-box protein [Bacteroidales bacterium]
MLKLIFELEVHQTELQLQNEELVLAKEAEREAANNYRELYDFAPVGYLTLSQDGRIQKLNLKCARMLGKDRGLLNNSNFNFFLSDSSRKTLKEFLLLVFSGLAKESCQLDLISESSSPIHVQAEGILSENTRECFITLTDITDNVNAARTLDLINRKLESILEAADEGILGIDMSGNIIFVNRKALELLGFSHEELIGHNAHKSFQHHRQDGKAYSPLHSLIMEVIYSGHPQSGEEYFWRKDGTGFQVDLSSFPLMNNEKIEGAVITFRDITERKDAELKLLELNEALDEKVKERTSQLVTSNKQMESFTYSISHDLRAPLRHIVGFISLLKEMQMESMSDEEHKYMDIIGNAAQEMGQLIDALLSFSRLNRAEVHIHKFNSNKLVKEVVEFFEPETIGRNIEFRISELPSMIGDEQLIKQVWLNLISNAIKYTGKKDSAIIEIGSKQNQGKTEFFVRDNGCGFDMRYADKLFGVFHRFHRVTDYEGIGIGLANVKSIVTRHGGECRAEGKLDEGATFYFTLTSLES